MKAALANDERNSLTHEAFKRHASGTIDSGFARAETYLERVRIPAHFRKIPPINHAAERMKQSNFMSLVQRFGCGPLEDELDIAHTSLRRQPQCAS